MTVGPVTLDALREALLAAREAYPELRRDIGRTLAAIDRFQPPQAPDPQRQPVRAETLAGALGGRGARRR